MALIQTIRNNSWILIIFIALGLIGFLMMDMGGGNAPQARQGQTLGVVNGREIDYNEFNQAERLFYGNQSNNFSNKEALWDYFVQKNLVMDEASAMGIGVGEEEKEGLLFGPDLSPVLQNQFINPATGQVDMQRLNTFRQNLESGQLDAQQEQSWNYFAETAVEDRIQNKVRNLVRKGVHTPSWMVEMKNNEQNTRYDLSYAVVPYSDITEANTEISDAEIKKYISDNPSKYKRDQELRSANYVFFEAVPTAADSAALRNDLDSLRIALGNSEKDSAFTLINRGIYSNVYVKPDIIDEFVSARLEESPVGATFGPYIQDGDYRVQKLIDKQILRDSVRVRQIAFSVNTQEALAPTHALVDSLKEALEAGEADFASLASQYSSDTRSKDNGGDMGFVKNTGFGPAFDNQLMYFAETGKIYKMYSQSAIHLVELLDTRDTEDIGYRMALLSRPIIPSLATQDAVSEKAYNFMYANRDRESFEQAVNQSAEVTMRQSENVDVNGYKFGILGESQTSRDIVKWMFEENTNVGTVAGEIFTYSDPEDFYRKYFVIPMLTNVYKPGLASPDDVREEVQAILTNQKKASWATSNLSSDNLNSLASRYGISVDTARGVTFSRPAIAGLGAEPEVVAALPTMSAGDSRCIGGNAGVICIRLEDVQAATPVVNMAQLRQFMNMSDENALPQAVFDAMKDGAKMEDNRATIF